MIANRVKETTSTTGTGSFTLTGAATGFQTFNTAFGLNRHFHYWAVDITAGTWETGIGHLSGTTTLVRDVIEDNSSNGTTAINFANAPTIFCAANERDVFTSAPNVYTGQRRLKSYDFVRATASTSQLLIDRFVGTPFKLLQGGLCTGAAMYVQTAGDASSTVRFGLYEVDTDGTIGRLLAESGSTASTGSTGWVSTTWGTSVVIPPGDYYIIAMIESTTAPFVYAGVPDYSAQTVMGNNGDAQGRPVTRFYTATVTTPLSGMPDPWTESITMTANADQPLFFLDF